ncbi:MAG: tol-pal system YbgF family protein, partial [Candidatus Zixiibacteriota bacterium]
MSKKIQQSVLLLLAMVVGVLFLSSCNENNDNKAQVEQHKKLAGELRDNRLYQAAVDEYENILSFNQIDFKTRANINYLIAKIYFENIRDYENASAFYIRARSLDPDGSFYNEASRNLVTSLEKMGNLLVAKRELDAIT